MYDEYGLIKKEKKKKNKTWKAGDYVTCRDCTSVL